VNRYDYYQPRSLDEAFRLKKSIPKSLYVSGGTDLIVRIKNKELHPRALISLRSIPNLCAIENGKCTRIGAMTTIGGLIQNSVLCEKYPVLIEAARELGSVQIRNMATIGGNLCNGSPAADMAPPLLVLEAKVRLQNGQKYRETPLEKFFISPGRTCLAPDELMTHILLEPPERDMQGVFMKKGRMKKDLATASVAVLLKTEGKRCITARIAAGSVAPVPQRLLKVESLLERAALSQELLTDAQKLASKSVSPITDIRSTKKYRCHLVGVLVKRALEKLAGWNQT
jgi:carbon-monoxide dehydrogenase medium subunit